jgi:hypothetical protein
MGTNGGIAHVQLPSIVPKTITQWRIAPDPYRQCLNANMVVRVDTSARRDHRLAPTLIDPNASPVPSLSCLDRAKVKRLQSSCMWPSSDGWTRHDNSTSGRTACEPSSPPPGSPCRNSAPSCTEHTAAWRFLLKQYPPPCRMPRSGSCSKPPGTQLLSSPCPDTHSLDPHDAS